jgi:UDP-N-acetylglucosamine:LPS N-acetylglucosamine transferase
LKQKKIILICSDGGHLAQILELKDLFIQYDYLLITEKTEATAPLRKKYNIKYLKSRPSGSRSIAFVMSLLSNLFLSFKLLIQHYPKVIITTGSHTAVPLCLLGKVFRVKIVWILSFARINTRAKSADFIYPLADRFIVQWESARELYPKSIYLGGIY